MLAVLLAAAPAPRGGDANAFELHPFRFATALVAYTVAEEALAPYVRAAAALWSGTGALTLVEGGDDITLRLAPLRPPIVFEHQAAQANVDVVDGIVRSCEVRLDPDRFATLSEEGRTRVVAHEIGHCLGIDHSTEAGLMRGPLLWGFSDDDAAAARARYPLPFQVFAPAVVVAP